MSQDNPWNLTQIERRAIAALTQTGSTKAAARLLAVDGLQISQALVRIRKRMGVANTILAVLAWDKHARGAGRCSGAVAEVVGMQHVADIVAGFISKARAAQSRGEASAKEWAHTLIRRHDAGETVRPYSLNLARAALGLNADMAVSA